MKQTVWKEILAQKSEQNIELPKDAEIIFAGNQYETFCIWYLCNPEEKEKETRVIKILGTGHNSDNEELKYIGTAILKGGGLVLHAFEKIVWIS